LKEKDFNNRLKLMVSGFRLLISPDKHRNAETEKRTIL